ncbi:glycerophosphodiester phosphodiesterase family protein [Phycicoccus sp. 3266]|uniref:glycerophosphodiester phosphodiesterase family protein n=1 Tax=Phycicoccus sp. 3266 TaxID=2817751 RepID=UPI0028542E64|nr:glycerophosphodiester phosphodiesterase family protein [Phycicoccus sp. 3266]MDR6865405.1 glycerophosphoryl diester phosphodiesterase [Phycicoccus sp. 3266]
MGDRLHRTVRALAAAAALAAGLAVAAPGPAGALPRDPDRVPSLVSSAMVVAHRGASGYRPEHTLEAYRVAVAQGADAIEPDLASTRDHVLVDTHDVELSSITDVADHPELADRRTTKQVSGITQTGWFVDDLTLAELKTLRVRERMPAIRPANTAWDGTFEVPTLDEVLALRAELSRSTGRAVVVYPESKNPTYFRAEGLPLEEPLVAALRANGLDSATAPVLVQSFEPTSLRHLRNDLGARTRLVQLVGGGRPYDFTVSGDPRTFADLSTATGLAWVARYAWAVAPDVSLVLPRRSDGRLGTPTGLVRRAHAAGLRVHVYTLRAENLFLPVDYRTGTDPATIGRAVDYDGAVLRAGVDGMFCDQPDLCLTARARHHVLLLRTWHKPRR